jgi:uncharacterized glyoxalase superfamily protein PhnB
MAGISTYLNFAGTALDAFSFFREAFGTEADRLHAALGAGESASMGMFEQFWGGYWGSCTDRFGISWMLDCAAPD